MKEYGVCPFCSRRVITTFMIDTGKDSKAIWYQCSCGCYFKKDKGIDKKVFDNKFKEDYTKNESIIARLNYQRKVYMPLISELTPGRTALIVGFTIPHDIIELRKDGWVAEGIDLIKDSNVNTTVGDFETYKFTKQYDVIIMQDLIQSFNDPMAAIFKATNLLNPGGVLFITTPEPKLINELGYREWGCWNNKQHNIYLGSDNILKLLQNLGMEVILKRENIEQRFNTWNNFHVIAQRIYGGENEQEDNVRTTKSSTKKV